MKSGRDATRRNRNIGTAKRGHGQNNRLVIPTRWHPDLTIYYQNLGKYRNVSRDVGGHPITFLVEETRAGCYHACTPDDIIHVLRFVAPSDLKGIELIVLRQPKRKEEALSGVWGRWASSVEIDGYSGSAVFLEAADIANPIRWPKSLAPDQQMELERLRGDGHTITTTKRYHIISLSLASVRSTQLYRTLIHEIGHHVDYSQDRGKFTVKLASEKETFAHRYADDLGTELRKRRLIPFERIISAEQLKEDKLRISDFEAT